jgi:indolepyruvate ferredoxin oxidoreductase alpha subunit
MKLMGDMLLTQKLFSEIVMGNTALVRAMIEAGTRVITSYPGSPTPEIATAIKSIPIDDRPFYFEFSTNEKVATEIAFGAAVNGHLSTVFFKSVGLNVASDTFMQLSLMNIIGGMVVVLGDDPGANSSQNEQDNRHFAHMSYTPVFEPASPHEVYSFYLAAAKLAQEKQMPVILRLTTHVCHAKERVPFGEYKPYVFDNTPKFNVENGPYIPITSLVFPQKERALKNIASVESYAEKTDINYVVDNKNPDKGIITMGLPFLSLMDVLANTKEKPDILKLGMIYPIPKKKIASFLKKHNQVKILEELDNILEKEVKSIAYDEGLTLKIHGKKDDDDWMGEYTPFKTENVLRKIWPDILPQENSIRQEIYDVPQRPAQMCPGCGHRSAFFAIKKALAENDIKVADIGCHTLGFLPPYNMGEILMCMGASTGIGSGLSLYNDTRKVVVFMGDSTFFHAGMPGIINALFNNHKITMIVMENGTTAMTGHQDHAATGHNFNEPTDKIPIRNVLEGFGIKNIYETDTYDQKKLTELTIQAVSDKGFSVVIAKHPCMLKYNREQRRKPDFVPRKVDIDKKSCTQINNCIEKFACPTFTRKDNGDIETNHDLCIGDGSCIQTCPSKAITSPKKV